MGHIDGGLPMTASPQKRPKHGIGDLLKERPLPMSRAEMDALGWDQLDVLLITGDAHVDHPSFGTALIGRFLVNAGYRVGIIAQPRWDTPDDVTRLGRPRLFAGVSAGALDSMLAHYTAFRKLRHDDAYTPGNRHGARPNRACIVYTGLVRHAFPGLPVVLGGVEASLRRASHYDFWTDKVRRSVLLDSKADLLVYGMGERAVLEVARRLQALLKSEIKAAQVPPSLLSKMAGTEVAGQSPPSRGDLELLSSPYSKGDLARALRGIPGTAFAVSSRIPLQEQGVVPVDEDMILLPSHELLVQDPKELMTATLALERQVHQGTHWAVQASGPQQVLFAPPAALLDTAELDAVHALPFTRRPHPSYKERIPAADMIQFSITAHRGCAGGCTFCSITQHQGRQIQSRSAASLLAEVRQLTRHPDWKGSISDVGGPTANMWGARCTGDPSKCKRADCLIPRVCPHFKTDNTRLMKLLREMQAVAGVKHLRVASGIRYDLDSGDGHFLRELVHEFVGGQLKVAPEHISDKVLRLMRKPSFARFDAFLELFADASHQAGREQYVIPYLISAFPGCTDGDMRDLARWLQQRGWRPRQVQCFIPTPGTIATAMYHAGIDPEGNPIFVAKTDRDRMRQHHILLPADTKGD
jgi:uncharacterized radical SAM protein YgiQ